MERQMVRLSKALAARQRTRMVQQMDMLRTFRAFALALFSLAAKHRVWHKFQHQICIDCSDGRQCASMWRAVCRRPQCHWRPPGLPAGAAPWQPALRVPERPRRHHQKVLHGDHRGHHGGCSHGHVQISCICVVISMDMTTVDTLLCLCSAHGRCKDLLQCSSV